MTSSNGWTAPGFEGVREAFDGNFERGEEVGAAFSAYHRGQKVVDIWGGVADESSGRPWEEDTLALVFSTTKGITAIAANQLIERGQLDAHTPAATYWPEFSSSGKEDITVEHLLSHQSGLEWIEGADHLSLEDVLDWDLVVEALAEQAARYKPGTSHGYHAVTYGWLVGELIRRVSGTTVGGYVQREFADILELDLWIGLPHQHHDRVSNLVVSAGGITGEFDPEDPIMKLLAPFLAPDGLLVKALGAGLDVFEDPAIWNSSQLRAAEIPAANGVCDARSLARLYAACVSEVDGIRLLSPEQVTDASTQRTSGPNTVLLNMDVQFGLGFMLPSSMIVMGGPHSFGHFGAGGSVGWADPDAELAIGYTMNKMALGLTGDLRSTHLVNACYDAIP